MIDRFGERELIQLTDDDGLDVINSDILNAAIEDAEAEINGYLSKYALPLATVPSVLVRKSCDIARYFLYDDAATEEVEKRFDKAVAFLLNVARGVISLGPDSQGDVAEVSSGAVMQSGGRVFGRDDNGFL